MITKIRTWWASATSNQQLGAVFGVGLGALALYFFFSSVGIMLPTIGLIILLTAMTGLATIITLQGSKRNIPALRGFGINGLAFVFYILCIYYITKYLMWPGLTWMPSLMKIIWVIAVIAMNSIAIGCISKAWGGTPDKRTFVAIIIAALIVGGYATLQTIQLTPLMDPVTEEVAVDAYEDIPAMQLSTEKERIRNKLGIAVGSKEEQDFERNWEIEYRVSYWYLVPRGVFSMRRGFSVLGDDAIIHLKPGRKTIEGQRDEFFLWICDKAGVQPNMDPKDMKRRIAAAVAEYQKTGDVTLQPSVTEQTFRDLMGKVVGTEPDELSRGSGGVHTPFEEIVIRKTPGNASYTRGQTIAIIVLLGLAVFVVVLKVNEGSGIIAILLCAAVAIGLGWAQCGAREMLGVNAEYLKPEGDQPLIGAVVPQVGEVASIGRLNTMELTGTVFGPMAFTVVHPSKPLTTMTYWTSEGWKQGDYPLGTPINYVQYPIVWVPPAENGDITHKVRLTAGGGIVVWAPVCVLPEVLRKYAGRIDMGITTRAENARHMCERYGGNPDMTEDNLRDTYGRQPPIGGG